MIIEEAEKFAHDHFIRRGYTEGEFRTTLGKNNVSPISDMRDVVHKSNVDGVKIGPTGILQLRENHSGESQTARWPAPPDGETVRAVEDLRPAIKRGINALKDGRPFLLDVHAERWGGVGDFSYHPDISIANMRRKMV